MGEREGGGPRGLLDNQWSEAIPQIHIIGFIFFKVSAVLNL